MPVDFDKHAVEDHPFLASLANELGSYTNINIPKIACIFKTNILKN